MLLETLNLKEQWAGLERCLSGFEQDALPVSGYPTPLHRQTCRQSTKYILKKSNRNADYLKNNTVGGD